jgi:hypothetical protein
MRGWGLWAWAVLIAVPLLAVRADDDLVNEVLREEAGYDEVRAIRLVPVGWRMVRCGMRDTEASPYQTSLNARALHPTPLHQSRKVDQGMTDNIAARVCEGRAAEAATEGPAPVC